MDDNTFIMGFQAPIRFAVYDTTSGFYQQYSDAFCTYVKDKITSNSMSGYFEANLDVFDKNTLLISGRGDKHEYSEWAISPRIAWITTLDNRNNLRAIYQHSVRLPAFIDLYSEHTLTGTSAKPEILKGFELIYNRTQAQNLTFAFGGHYHTIDQIAWLPTSRAGLVGRFELAGFDAEVKYSAGQTTFGANYSFIKQLSWDSETEISGYIDVNLEPGAENVEKIYLSDYGENRINNLPLHSIKAYYNRTLTKDLSLHFDCRVAFDYQQEVLLKKVKDVHDIHGSAESRNEMNAIYEALHDHGYGENSFTSNFSLNFEIPSENLDTKISLYAMNILSVNHVRYVIQYWEVENLRQYPRQCGFIEEPLTVGLKCSLQF